MMQWVRPLAWNPGQASSATTNTIWSLASQCPDCGWDEYGEVIVRDQREWQYVIKKLKLQNVSAESIKWLNRKLSSCLSWRTQCYHLQRAMGGRGASVELYHGLLQRRHSVPKILRKGKRLPESLVVGFPGGSDGKESACNAVDPALIPGPERSPGEGKGNPLQYSLLENPMDRGAWWATVRGVTKS